MTGLKILSAAAAIAAMMATPALAQVAASPYDADGSYNLHMPGTTDAQPNSPSNGLGHGYGEPLGYSYGAPVDSYAYAPGPGYRGPAYHRSGFLPADIAADAIGGAVGIASTAVNTAGAIATAPFRAGAAGDAYASMDTGDNSCAQRFRSYDPASGTYLGYDGQRHACR